MAKNELLPFADGEDANVLPTNQWEALTDILENGFQSGIARSEQVNRVLAQGAVASYVLGQLIVDQLNKDATLDKDTLYQNLILALQENAKDACLPLVGGTMFGTIKFGGNIGYLECLNTDGYFQISGAPWGSGARITLYGKDHTENGAFSLLAQNAMNSSHLHATPGGPLTWNGNNVVTSEGGNFTGNVTGQYGDAFTWGNIRILNDYIFKTTTNGSNNLCSNSSYNNGPSVSVYGPDYASEAFRNKFFIRAGSGTQKELIGSDDGLTWDGYAVSTIVLNGNTFIRYDDGTQICWGRIDVEANQSTAVQTFPLAFANTEYAITITTLDDNVTAYPFNIGTRMTTGFVAWCRSTNQFDRAASWIAIGRWR